MKTRVFFIFFLSICYVPIMAQIRSHITNTDTRLVLDAPRYNTSRYSKRNDTVRTENFALYSNIIRKHSWYVGVGKQLSQDEANKLPVYFRLEMKNRRGNWQHIQALHQDTMTTAHSIATYVFNKYDGYTEQNREWFEKLNSVTQWFITSSIDGSDVVEERAYDAEGNMVYGFIPIKNAEGKVIGTYSDAWGLPAEMREDPTMTYGSVVCITMDQLGRDSIVDFLDGQGLRKLNSNGVDQQRYVYDEKNRLILVTAHNLLGDYTVDIWGNCGNRYIYDDVNNKYSIIRLDQELKAMRMPNKKANDTQTFIRCDVILDEWGREVERIMLDEAGNKDATIGGVHRIVYKYDNKGNLLSTTYYNLQGEVISL